MSPLVRAKHPKIVLGVVGTALAVPVLGITISLVGANANTQQEVSMQDMSMEGNTQDTASVQQETVQSVASAAAAVVESQPAQSPLPDPLAPEPSASNTPESETTAELKKTAEAETATPTPTSEPKGTKTPEPPVMNEPKIVKKTTEVVGGWTAPVVNPGTVSLRAPQLNSDANVTLTVACSPSANCVINGDQLTITEGTIVTVTYRAKATSTHTAWATIIRSE